MRRNAKPYGKGNACQTAACMLGAALAGMCSLTRAPNLHSLAMMPASLRQHAAKTQLTRCPVLLHCACLHGGHAHARSQHCYKQFRDQRMPPFPPSQMCGGAAKPGCSFAAPSRFSSHAGGSPVEVGRRVQSDRLRAKRCSNQGISHMHIAACEKSALLHNIHSYELLPSDIAPCHVCDPVQPGTSR